MVNQSHTDVALKIWKENKKLLNIGLHLCLDMGKPLVDGWDEYLDGNNNFLRSHPIDDKSKLINVPKKLIRKELLAQIEKAESCGCKITHIDSHHHVHLRYPHILEVVVAVAKEKNIKIRKKLNLIDTFYDEKVTEDLLLKKLKIAKKKNLKYVELMCHISKEDEELAQKSTYYIGRIKEAKILKSTITKDKMTRLNINLGTY